jgi:hypothetical protein
VRTSPPIASKPYSARLTHLPWGIGQPITFIPPDPNR